jgi:hypothetical protein
MDSRKNEGSVSYSSGIDSTDMVFNGYTSEMALMAWINTVHQIFVNVILGVTTGALDRTRPVLSR